MIVDKIRWWLGLCSPSMAIMGQCTCRRCGIMRSAIINDLRRSRAIEVDQRIKLSIRTTAKLRRAADLVRSLMRENEELERYARQMEERIHERQFNARAEETQAPTSEGD